ncbi:MAG: hypothetical protein AB1349_13875 [Elusimicrobiota bacterium]
MLECKNCGNEVSLTGVGTLSQQLGICPVCGYEQPDTDVDDSLFFDLVKLNSPVDELDRIRKSPVRTERDLKLKVEEVVIRVAYCVYKSALKKYSAELSQNQKKNPCISEGVKCSADILNV